MAAAADAMSENKVDQVMDAVLVSPCEPVICDVKKVQYPLTDGKGFFVNVAIIGEVSSGKSTLLNAIFGDFLAETDIDRATKSVQRFYESMEAKSNSRVLDQIKSTNEMEDEKLNSDLAKLEKHRQKFIAFRWVDLILNNVPKPQFSDLPSFKVKQSDLIPRKGEFDNTFSIIDFPGFNDPKLDEYIFQTLGKQCDQFDFIFYVIDCQTGLRNKSSQECFGKVMKTIEKSLQNGHTRLVILFNKYDLVSVRTHAKKFVCNQRKEITKQLLSTYNIPKEKFQFFNVSANNLLIQRVLLNQDCDFLGKHEELMDEINVFCGEFLSRKEILRLNKLPIDKRLKAISDAMMKEKEIEDAMLIEDGASEHKEGQTPDLSPSSTTGTVTPGSSDDGDDGDENENEEDLDAILQFLRELRDVRVMKEKAMAYLSNLKMETFDDLVEFFVCVFCLTRNHGHRTQKRANKNKNVLEVLMRGKLEEMVQNMSKDRQNVKLLRKSVIYTLVSLQYCLPSLDDDKFCFGKFIHFLTVNEHLKSGLLNQLKEKIDLSKNEDYYYQVCQSFVRALVINYVEQNGKQKICKVDVLVDDIFKYFANEPESQFQLLQCLLTHYAGVKDVALVFDSSRAIELLQYYFDDCVLRTLFSYDEYEQLCCKHIRRKDKVFAKLIQKLTSIVKV